MMVLNMILQEAVNPALKLLPEQMDSDAARLMHRLGSRPPAEAEAEHYAQQPADQPVGR